MSTLHDELPGLPGVTAPRIINVLNKWRSWKLVTFDGRATRLANMEIDRFGAMIEA